VEKYFKALLCEAGVAFPRTHDLAALLKLLLPLEPLWPFFSRRRPSWRIARWISDTPETRRL
jgi:HEPN domain-containing protein